MNTLPQMRDPFPHRHFITGEPHDGEGRPLTLRERTFLVKRAEGEYLRKMDEYHGVIHSLGDLSGFSLLGLSRYKPGVVRFVAVRGNEQRVGLAADIVFAAVQLPP